MGQASTAVVLSSGLSRRQSSGWRACREEKQLQPDVTLDLSLICAESFDRVSSPLSVEEALCKLVVAPEESGFSVLSPTGCHFTSRRRSALRADWTGRRSSSAGAFAPSSVGGVYVV